MNDSISRAPLLSDATEPRLPAPVRTLLENHIWRLEQEAEATQRTADHNTEEIRQLTRQNEELAVRRRRCLEEAATLTKWLEGNR